MKRKYTQYYNEWEQDPTFKSWLCKSKVNTTRFHCKACNCEVLSRVASLKEHMAIKNIKNMKGYSGISQLRTATRFGRMRVLLREFVGDIWALWRYGAPFPTFLKLIGTLILCLIVILPLIYPFFVLIITYFTFESLYLCWRLDQPWRFQPMSICRHVVARLFRPCNTQDIWKVREVLTRGILLAHSLATSVDYLCVMQGLLDEA